MLRKGIVEKIKKKAGFYAPHVTTNISSFAAIPDELLNEIEIGDEVTIYSSDYLSYGGFCAVVIETPRAKLENM